MSAPTTPRTELELDVLLARKEVLADGVLRLTLRHPEGEPLPPWEPGAHLDLVLRPDLVRQYSLCGDPADRSVLQVAVLREPGGRAGSRHVHEALADGDRLRIRGPRNHFPLVDAPRYLFIAGGIGITPIVPMIAAAQARGADWRLVYGGRSRGSMAFREELSERYGDRVGVFPQDETGLLDLDTLLGEPRAGTAVYCCGPEPLLAAVEQRCAAWPSGALHVERFSPKEGADDGEKVTFEVELAQSGVTITVPADYSILHAVEEAGITVLSSCQEGTCGTCETTVLEGVPDHRDSLLTEEEQAANDTMMICVSRCRGPKLVLDL
ncbi:PDR/VanB family oxidoreductase [Amycolatopsis acidiphila]|uniref:Oxidoreductase n=1 Tax=Amycolatopsis acidiphila TaxID=715473 RepID=A0A558A575_9PSEU|nr:PDR/VanB family oxidoreductase [Amycolatopsis acidiphila]TVT19405.1 oxidoreductase [Amycolatopsis acidiphila]UIJ56788.1 PDR/VanB family oxidoreductase [Amycolatopsis acidiphila]GHG55101.1 ferredoxin [Amycolatopsis acidiphila]